MYDFLKQVWLIEVCMPYWGMYASVFMPVLLRYVCLSEACRLQWAIDDRVMPQWGFHALRRHVCFLEACTIIIIIIIIIVILLVLLAMFRETTLSHCHPRTILMHTSLMYVCLMEIYIASIESYNLCESFIALPKKRYCILPQASDIPAFRCNQGSANREWCRRGRRVWPCAERGVSDGISPSLGCCRLDRRKQKMIPPHHTMTKMMTSGNNQIRF